MNIVSDTTLLSPILLWVPAKQLTPSYIMCLDHQNPAFCINNTVFSIILQPTICMQMTPTYQYPQKERVN